MIAAAVTAHSAPKEVSRDHQYWPLIALPKDADGLDRDRPRALRAVVGGRDAQNLQRRSASQIAVCSTSGDENS